MKVFFFMLLAFFSMMSSFGQRAQVSFSNDFKIGENEYKDQTVSHSVYHHSNFYTVTNSGVGAGKWLFSKLYDVKFSVTLARYDVNMNKLKEVNLENGAKIFGPLIPKIVFFNNKIFLAYYKANNTEAFDVYLASVNENDLSVGEPKKICTIQQENVGIFKLEAVITGGLVYFTTSPDNTKLLVACKGSSNKMQTFILNQQLDIVKQAKFQVGLQEFTTTSAVLTNDDKICFVISSGEGTRIVGINPEGKKSELRFNPAGNLKPYFTRANISRDGKTIFIFSTTTPTDQTNTWCNGMMISTFDLNTFKIAKPSTYEFTPEFIQSIAQMGGGEKRKKEFFMHNFDPNLLELENGSIAIIGSPEAINSNTSSSTPNRNNQSSTVATTIYKAGPVIVFFPDLKGKTFDQVVIPRKIIFTKMARSGSGSIQLVQSPSVSSSSAGLVSSTTANEIVVIYNDNETNLLQEEGKKTVTTKAAGDLALAEAFIGKDKKLAYRKLVSESQKDRSAYYLGNTIPTSTSSIVFPIAKEGLGFNARKIFFTNWCFLNIQ